MVSLMEIETKHGQEVLELNVYEVAGIVFAFAIVGYCLSQANHRRPVVTVPLSSYEKTDKILLQLDDSEKLSMSQIAKAGPDYVQF